MDSIRILSVESGAVNALSVNQAIVAYPSTYEGEYTVTPSDETQILPTADKKLAHDIVINPVPSNYGRISWNGSVLTVS